MLFRPELVEKILRQEKTQTRRIKKPGEMLVTGRDGTKFVAHLKGSGLSLTNSRLKWQTGKTYAIQPGRGKPAVGRFLLLDIREEPLKNITEEDAIAEGIPEWVGLVEEMSFGAITPITEFYTLWDSINNRPGQRVEDNPTVYALIFELVEAPKNA